ncbi:MAG TPA: four helix bundle protein [Chitinophagaceae bacterium]|nr:four helix bundle protein [Chitinophagaceae bacterium]
MFSPGRRFGISSQLARAAVSIPANIAEGSSRESDKDYARFIQIALGSASEAQTNLIIAKEMDWINNTVIEELESLLEEELKMLHTSSRKPRANS